MREKNSKFEKINKKYALNNSYFKNRRSQDPNTPFEVLEYVREHNELPYSEELTDDWFYECFIEYQKRAGVYHSQFFTPTKTARTIAEIAYGYTQDDNSRVLDACCGFGQITKELHRLGLKQITAFDIDTNLTMVCDYLVNIDLYAPQVRIYTEDFTDEENIKGVRGSKYDIVVSNPPYEVKELTNFLSFLDDVLYQGGVAILLIPIGFMDKSRPKKLVEILNNFNVINRTAMEEKFARTNINAEIVEIRKV